MNNIKCIFALAGNPNSGKTTLFNELTGSHYEVGNHTGVTVERKEGICKNIYHKHGELHNKIRIVDLPGIYSMSPYSAEEIITRDYILKDNPELILNIVDATNLERNLYLTTQLAEAGFPMVIALNMMDAVEKTGFSINPEILEKQIGIRVLPISASKGTGILNLITESLDIANAKAIHEPVIKYEDDIEACIKKLNSKKPLSRLSCLKLLLGETSDKDIDIESIRSKLKNNGENLADRITSARYAYIRKTAKKCRRKTGENKQFRTTEKIDGIAMHPIFAIPVFALIMFLIFQITFGSFGSTLTDLVDNIINIKFAGVVGELLKKAQVSDFATSLVTGGIIAGVGGVITFFPQIMLLFLFLSFLEDSGYMARIAFIMDKIFMKFGLSGKSFVPMIMGFGCTVPAVMSARTLDNEHDRLTTVLITPFMSCGAKMPVYAMITAALFPENTGIIITSLYFIGIVLGIISALIFSKTILKGEKPAFVLELPAYRMPTLKSTFHHMWEKAKDFMIRAGTVLLAGSMVIWFMTNLTITLQPVGESDTSVIGVIGNALAQVFSPCGFGNAEAAVSLISGLVAKEAVISTMSILYNATDTAMLTSTLAAVFTPLSAYSFLIFVLLYTPCIAAVSAIHSELKSWKLTAFSVAYQIGSAWTMSALIYNIGKIIIR